MEEGPTAGHLDGNGGSHGLGWGCFFRPSEDAGHHKHKVVSEWQLLSHVRLSVTPQTVAHQASLAMGFSRQE